MGTPRIGGGWLHRVGLCGDPGELREGRENVIHRGAAFCVFLGSEAGGL